MTDSRLLWGVFEKRRDDGVGSCVTVEAIGTLTHGVAAVACNNATGKCNGRGLDARRRRDSPIVLLTRRPLDALLVPALHERLHGWVE